MRTKYKWEFAERGNVYISGGGLDYFMISSFIGEYTTFIDSKSQLKKHVIRKLDWKKLHKHLSENGEKEHSWYFKTYSKKSRYSNVVEKFIDKLNKESLTIIDKDWLVEK